LPRTIAEDHDNTRAKDKTRGTAIDFNGKAGLWRLLPWSRDWLSPCPRLGTGDGHRRGLHRRCLDAENVRLTSPAMKRAPSANVAPLSSQAPT
jgi:hypothetical protein